MKNNIFAELSIIYWITFLFDSAIPEKYKYNLINCLVDRAFKINSNETTFQTEIKRLKTFFLRNSFPFKTIKKTIDNKIHSLRNNINEISSVPRKKIYLSIPFIDKRSNFHLNKDIQDLIRRFYPQINLNIIFRNDFSIQNFFPYKDKVPVNILSNIVYKFKCEQCDATYYGETKRHLQTRIAEHKGIYPITGKSVPNPQNSKIMEHAIDKNHPIKNQNFSILFKSKFPYDHKIAESLLIKRDAPDLNSIDSVYLYTFN